MSAPTIDNELIPSADPAPKSRFLSGQDALFEGILAHRRGEQGRETAAFISGYRGSPLGGFDTLLWKSADLLAAEHITFKPGLNEDLAATACWGTQQLALMEAPHYRSVTAFWYGKGPGVDRAGDAIKHANFAGTMPDGGVVMIVGDDHGAKSSTVAHQSDQALIAAHIPILYPATLQEYVDHLPTAVALSRFAGLWTAFKCVTEIIESSCSVDIGEPGQIMIEPEVARPPGGFHIGSGHQPLEQERTLFSYRLPAAIAFAEANSLDRVMLEGSEKHLGIVAPGKSYVDVLEALRSLGIAENAAALGIGIYKPLMIWPLASRPVMAFVRGYREIFVIEEKRGVVEEQLAGMLLRMPPDRQPHFSGKLDAEGRPLLPHHGEFDARMIAQAIGHRLQALGIGGEALAARLAVLSETGPRPVRAGNLRLPAFCSGCPHNRSTKIPDGSMALGGIGCHGMALLVPELRTPSATHMGGEGANWIGLADYVSTPHIFQNMGEGTYAHSGLLAIRAAVAADANITFKILFNSATAMTGGQPVEGEFTADDIARQLLAERVRKVVLLTEEPERARPMPPGVDVRARTDLKPVQEDLRDIVGVTALIYEQGCAAERRRLRKVGSYPDPPVRTYINPDVCEGCGDCSRKSNCVSIIPLETELGRKRAIDQESCNKDYSCVEGFCPSFVTVKGGQLAAQSMDQSLCAALDDALEAYPVTVLDQPCNLLVAGIGGTGIITLGATIAKAALEEGKRVSSFDVTGLAQKNGAVYSHIRIFAGDDERSYPPRIAAGQLDVLIGCDMASAAAPAVWPLFDGSKSSAFINGALVPTAAFQRQPDMPITTDPYIEALAAMLPQDRLGIVAPETRLSKLLGQGILMNVAILGYAFQKGTIPIDALSIDAAMVRGGKPDMASRSAFRFGRLLAVDARKAEALAGGEAPPRPVSLASLPLEDVITRCRALLTAYQNSRLADRYEAFVRTVALKDTGTALSHAVAVNLFKLMRYKDEYEVARLYAAPEFLAGLRRDFSGDFDLIFNLAPSLLAWGKTAEGEPRKIRFGSWVLGLFKLMARFKWLRGTPFDPFGWSRDRKLERTLIGEYRAWIEEALLRMTAENYDLAVDIAEIPALIRGYGRVKERSIETARSRHDVLAAELKQGARPAIAIPQANARVASA